MTQEERIRKVTYAGLSFLIGVWTFNKVNSISGPVFEPIVAACTNPDISVDDFASKTGYHAYDDRVGLKVFNFLVCLITQFLLELRETHPAGVLVWGGIFVVSLPYSAISTAEGGRAGARGPIRYPVIMGLLAQLLGISVVVPLIWLPSFVFGEGRRGSPVSLFRVYVSALLSLPAIILTLVVFLAPTDSQLWTTSAGMLGGPILALSGLVLLFDSSEELSATDQNVKAYSTASKHVFKMLFMIGLVGWYTLVAIFYQSYGISFGDLWNDIWVNANASVAFMTVDAGIFYLTLLMYIAYRSDEMKAAKAFFLTTVLGPAAACCLALIEIQNETKFIGAPEDEKKKN